MRTREWDVFLSYPSSASWIYYSREQAYSGMEAIDQSVTKALKFPDTSAPESARAYPVEGAVMAHNEDRAGRYFNCYRQLSP